MQKRFNFGAGFFFLLWVATAQAQQLVAPGFGDELRNIPWQAWALVGFFAIVGIMARIQEAIKAQEVAVAPLDVIAWVLAGLFAGFLAFAGCEYAKEITGHRIPDLVEGAIISLAAYNRQDVITWATARLRAIFRPAAAETTR